MKKTDLRFISSIIVCVTILISVGLFAYFDFLKEEQRNKQKEKNRINFTECVDTAGRNRITLWSANCPSDDPSCVLSMDLIEWIDNRYKQEVEECRLKWIY